MDGIIPVEDLENTTSEVIAEALVREWLDFYVTETDDPEMLLIDYRIEAVNIPGEWQECISIYDADFIAQIYYSVKPAGEPPHGWMINGDFGEDNWMLNKELKIAVRKSDSIYQMLILGIPIC